MKIRTKYLAKKKIKNKSKKLRYRSNYYSLAFKFIIIIILYLICNITIDTSIIANITKISHEFNNKEENIFINELSDYQNQTFNLFVPSGNNLHCPRTIYFQSNYDKYRINNKSEKFLINKINLNNKNKKYFIIIRTKIFKHYKNLIEKNGILIGNNIYNINYNIYLSSFSPVTIKYIHKKLGINKNQKFYFFPKLRKCFSKDSTYLNYKLMKKKFIDDYNYMSETFYYPGDKTIIMDKFNNYIFNKNDLWLVKPAHDYGGNGIHILKSLKEINLKEYLITKYITNLDLIGKRKYDLRILVLIVGLKPLRLYLYKNGFVRRCVNEFSLDINSINDRNIHLSNTHVNIMNKNYIHPKNIDDINANIWSLNTYKKYLEKKNVNYDVILDKIKDIIIKSIISIYHNLINTVEKFNLDNINFFNLLGYDILMTNNYEPKLIEINTIPSLLIYNELMRIIKSNFIIDTLNLIGVLPFSHEKNPKTLFKEYSFKNIIDFKINDALCEINRPKGDYELIFPLKKNIEKYKKFLSKIDIENSQFWEKIPENI